MSVSLSARLLEKAVAALVAAVEIYNKPQFAYRDECFALLAINAWELLLKARLLQLNCNDSNAIIVREPRTTKRGDPSKKLFIKKNRSGNPMTIGLSAVIKRLNGMTDVNCRLPGNVRANIEALVEIRDNAAHYVNISSLLSQQVMEISAAAIKNFVLLANSWFGRDLSDELSLVLPLCFIGDKKQFESVLVGGNERRLMSYLQKLAGANAASGDEFDIAVKVEVKLARSKLEGVPKFVMSNAPDAIKMQLSEEQIRDRYPWNHAELKRRMKERYNNFVENKKFHDIKKEIRGDRRYMLTRYLDPKNTKSAKKDFYSENVLTVFDQHYERQQS